MSATMDKDLEHYFEALNKEITEVLSPEGTEVLATVAVENRSVHVIDSEMSDEADGVYYLHENGSKCLQSTESKVINPKPKLKSNEKPTPSSSNASVRATKRANFATKSRKEDNKTLKNKTISHAKLIPNVVVKNEADYCEIYEFESPVTEEATNDVQLLAKQGTEALDVNSSKNVKKDSGGMLRCTLCNYTTPKAFLLYRHMRGHSNLREFTCNVCEKDFKSLTALSSHLNVHLGRKPFSCKWCNMCFTTSGEMTRHVRYKHTHEKPHKCSECNYSSVELSKLRRHIRSHTGERPYQCPHCTYASPDTFKLKRHLRVHTGDRPYECEICHSRFTQSNSLKAHRMIHNVGDKPVFQCPFCPTTCGRKTDLRLHLQRQHESENPIPCKLCGRELADRYSLKLHMKTHDGERCYHCDLCSYAATTRCNLEMHKRVHSKEKPYECSFCDKSFRQMQLLVRHKNLYHNDDYKPSPRLERKHQCPSCSRVFAHKGNMLRHMTIHDIDTPSDSIKQKNKESSTALDDYKAVGNGELYGIDEKDYIREDKQGDEFTEYVEDSLETEDTFVKYEIMETDEDLGHQIANMSTVMTSTDAVQATNNYTSFHMEFCEENDAVSNFSIVKEEKEDDISGENIDGIKQYMIVKVFQNDKEENSCEDLANMDNIEVIELPANPAREAHNNNSFGFV